MARKQREYSYEDYRRAMELLNKGLGLGKVSKKLDIPKTTLWEWRHGRKPPLAKWIPEPSKELSYVIGVLLGDGYIVRVHGYHYDIELSVTDYEFAMEFSRAMAKLLNRRYVKPKWIGVQRGRNYGWRIYYDSKAFYTWFKNSNLDSLKPFIEYNMDTVKYFLRGLYDSEGCNYKCRRIYLGINSIKLLKYVQYLLKRYFDIIATGPYLNKRTGEVSKKKNGEIIITRHDTYYIAINRKQHVKRFLNEVGFSIREKQLGLPRRR